MTSRKSTCNTADCCKLQSLPKPCSSKPWIKTPAAKTRPLDLRHESLTPYTPKIPEAESWGLPKTLDDRSESTSAEFSVLEFRVKLATSKVEGSGIGFQGWGFMVGLTHRGSMDAMGCMLACWTFNAMEHRLSRKAKHAASPIVNPKPHNPNTLNPYQEH